MIMIIRSLIGRRSDDIFFLRLVLSQIASGCLDIENSEVSVWSETGVNKIFQKYRDSLIEQSNTLIEQSLHATERMKTI